MDRKKHMRLIGRAMTPKNYRSLVAWEMRANSLTWGDAARQIRQRFPNLLIEGSPAYKRVTINMSDEKKQ